MLQIFKSCSPEYPVTFSNAYQAQQFFWGPLVWPLSLYVWSHPDLLSVSSHRAIQESLSLSLSGGEGVDVPAGSPSGSSPEPPLTSPPSYSSLGDPRATGAFGVAPSFDEQLRLAMEISCREQEELDRSGT